MLPGARISKVSTHSYLSPLPWGSSSPVHPAEESIPLGPCSISLLCLVSGPFPHSLMSSCCAPSLMLSHLLLVSLGDIQDPRWSQPPPANCSFVAVTPALLILPLFVPFVCGDLSAALYLCMVSFHSADKSTAVLSFLYPAYFMLHSAL